MVRNMEESDFVETSRVLDKNSSNLQKSLFDRNRALLLAICW